MENKLITTAPELLEACQQLVDVWNKLGNDWKFQQTYASCFDAAVGMASEAIKKIRS